MSETSAPVAPPIDISDDLGPVSGPEPAPDKQPTNIHTSSTNPQDDDPTLQDPELALQALQQYEASSKKEKPSEATRRQETEELFQTAAMAEGTKAIQKREKKGKLTPQEQTFAVYKRIYDHIDSPQPYDFVANDKENHKGWNFADEPIFITKDLDNTDAYLPVSPGSGQKITLITEKFFKDGKPYFRCQVENADEVEVDARVVQKAFTLAHSEDFTNGIGSKSQEARTIAESYINSIENPDAEIPNDATIQEAGRSIGVVTTEAASKLINDSETSSELKKELLSYLEGKNIATPDDIGKILFKLNNLDSHLNAQRAHLSDMQEMIEQEEAILAELPQNSQARYGHEEKIAHFKVELKAAEKAVQEMEAIQKSMEASNANSPEALAELVRNSYNSGQSGKLEAAIRSGNYTETLKTLFDLLPEGHPMKSQLRSFIEAAGKYGGIGVAAIVILMVMQSMGSK